MGQTKLHNTANSIENINERQQNPQLLWSARNHPHECLWYKRKTDLQKKKKENWFTGEKKKHKHDYLLGVWLGLLLQLSGVIWVRNEEWTWHSWVNIYFATYFIVVMRAETSSRNSITLLQLHNTSILLPTRFLQYSSLNLPITLAIYLFELPAWPRRLLLE